jgi:hypothetical protein
MKRIIIIILAIIVAITALTTTAEYYYLKGIDKGFKNAIESNIIKRV